MKLHRSTDEKLVSPYIVVSVTKITILCINHQRFAQKRKDFF